MVTPRCRSPPDHGRDQFGVYHRPRPVRPWGQRSTLRNLALGFGPEDGCLWVYDTRREVQAFTYYGVENLITLLEDMHGWTPSRPQNLWNRIKVRLVLTTDQFS